MAKLAAAILIAILFASNALAFQQKGSVEAYRQAAANERAAAMAAQAWKTATKITVLDKTPAEPHSGARSLGDLKTGYVGYVEEWELTVVSVINANEMILNSSNGLIWLADYPTKDFVDDQVCRIVGPIRCGETKTYATVDGDKATIRVVRLVPASEVGEMERKTAEAEEAKLYRTFTDVSGKFTFEGKFVEYKNQVAVIIRRDNQKRLEIRLTQLSKPDVEWIQAELKSRREAEEKRKAEEKKSKKR